MQHERRFQNNMIRGFFLILLSVFTLMIGLGLQNTLVGVRAGLEDFSNYSIGAIMALYFVGFVIGSLTGPALIERVGHIRAFSTLATLGSIAAIAHSLSIEPVFWALLRGLTGFTIAGLYIVVESWLNGRADNAGRGQLLGLYFFVNLGAVALGQQMLRLEDPRSFELFAHSSVLLSLAIVPVALTRLEAPAPVRSSGFSLSALARVSPFALLGAGTAGLANGAFWGLAPLYGVRTGLDATSIAIMMSVIILGGAAFQYPLGRLSDRIDRRIVIAAANLALAAVALLIAVNGLGLDHAGLALALLFGGLLLTQYSLCVAHANDFVADGDFVRLASALLLVFGSGAALGPVATAAFMESVGPSALFLSISIVSAASAVYAMWRMTRRAAPSAEDSSDFAPVGAMLSPSLLAPTDEAFDGIAEDNDGPFQMAEGVAPAPAPAGG